MSHQLNTVSKVNLKPTFLVQCFLWNRKEKVKQIQLGHINKKAFIYLK